MLLLLLLLLLFLFLVLRLLLFLVLLLLVMLLPLLQLDPPVPHVSRPASWCASSPFDVPMLHRFGARLGASQARTCPLISFCFAIWRLPMCVSVRRFRFRSPRVSVRVFDAPCAS